MSNEIHCIHIAEGSSIYPIAVNFSPLNDGRHCCTADLDKVDLLYRLINYENQYRAAKLGPWSRKGLQAVALVGSCFEGRSNKRFAPITERILRRHRTTIQEQLPALELMEEAGIIQLANDIDCSYIIFNKVKPLDGPTAEPLVTKIVTEDMRASGIPSGTILQGETMMAFGNHRNRQFGKYAHFANTIPGGDDIYLTLDFVITKGPFAGQFVSQDYKIGDTGESPQLDGDRPEFRQIANSALNLFPWDESLEAQEMRELLSIDVHGPFWNLQEQYLVIEIGDAADVGSANNLVRIIEPGHPGYLPAMDLGRLIQAGTGVLGDHVPPDSTQHINSLKILS
jgi:hypothetical protein